MEMRDWFRFGHVAIFGFTAVLPLIDPLTRWAIILAFTLPLLTADWLIEQLQKSSIQNRQPTI